MWFLGLCKNPHLHRLWGWSMTSGGQGAAAAGLSMSGELLLEAFLSLPAAPAFTLTLFISLLKIFLPFLFSPLSPLLVRSLVSSFSFSPLPFSFLCSSLPLFSFSSLFIPSSTSLPSFCYCPVLSSPIPSPSSSLTKNTPTRVSSTSCDGSGGWGSPCAPASPWVRAQTSIAYCCTSPGRNCQSSPLRPVTFRPRRISFRTYSAPHPTPIRIRRLSSPEQPGAGSMERAGPVEGRIPQT